MRLGYWLFMLSVLSVAALARQSTETIPDPGQSAPTLPQIFDHKRLAANTLAQPWKVALPPIEEAPLRCPALSLFANEAADPAFRRWQVESAAGNKLVANLEQHVTLISDPTVTDYLNRLEQAIVRSSHLRGCFEVKLVNDVEINAYSLPGGFLYVTTGLILAAGNEAELVAALSHETGHVTARHLTTIKARRQMWSRLSLAGGPAGYVLRWQLGPLFTLKLLRNAEFEADRLALKYASASGYDPDELAHLLQDASLQEEEATSFFARLFDAHPSTAARVKRVKQAMGRNRDHESQSYAVDTDEFHEMKGRLADLMRVPNPDLLPQRELAEKPSCSGPQRGPQH